LGVGIYNVGQDVTMAKKTSKSSESPTAPPAAPAKRRAPAQKKSSSPAAPAIDVATLGGTEPLARASDTGVGPGASSVSTTTPNNGGQPSHHEIAEAAYFRHLNRGGPGGDQFNDWLQAERELRERKR
jgi:hypothetical protein